MRRCRAKNGRFKRCGGGSRKVKRRKGKSCKHGVSKTTGKCLKHPRKRR